MSRVHFVPLVVLLVLVAFTPSLVSSQCICDQSSPQAVFINAADVCNEIEESGTIVFGVTSSGSGTNADCPQNPIPYGGCEVFPNCASACFCYANGKQYDVENEVTFDGSSGVKVLVTLPVDCAELQREVSQKPPHGMGVISCWDPR